MIETTVIHTDFFFFSLGFIFLLAFLNCQALKKALPDKIAWKSLSLFALSQTAYFCLNLIQQFKNIFPHIDSISPFFSALSFVLLGAFALNFCDHPEKLPKLRKWWPISLILAGAGLLHSLEAFAYSQAVFIGLPSICFAAIVFIKGTIYKTKFTGLWPKVTGVSLITYNIVNLLTEVKLITSGSYLEIGSKIVASSLFASSLWFCASNANAEELSSGLEKNQKAHKYFLPISLLLAFPLGYVLSILLTDSALTNEKEIKKSQGNAFAFLLDGHFEHADLLAESLSRASGIVKALVKPCSETIDLANSAMDQFAYPFPHAVAYLIDMHGNTIASSNRDSDKSFVGKNFSFRPYFKEALEGRTSFYLSKGTVSKEHGYYRAFPIRIGKGMVLGVAVYKITMAKVISSLPDDPPIILLDETDETIVSNRPDEFWNKLLPIDKTSFLHISVKNHSRSTLELSFRPVNSNEPIARHERNLFLWRYNLTVSNWSFYMLERSVSLLWARLLGISVTLFSCLILLGVSTVWHISLATAQIVEKNAKVYQTLVEGSSNIVALMDFYGNFLALNEAGQKEFQLSSESLAGVNLGDLWHDNSIGKVHLAIQEAVSGKKSFTEVFRINSEGLAGFWEITLNPIIEKKSKPSQLIGIFHNITSAKIATQELSREKDFTTNLLNTAQAIILFLDMTGKVIRVNQYFYDLTGFKKEEVINKNWMENFIPDQDQTSINSFFQERSPNFSGEPNINKILKADGDTLEIEWKNRTLKSEDGKPVGVISVGQDVTEHIKLQNALRESKTKFSMLNDCFTRFGNSPEKNIILLTEIARLLTGSDIAITREMKGEKFNLLGLSTLSEQLTLQQIDSCPHKSEIVKIGKAPVLIKDLRETKCNSDWMKSFNSMIVCSIYLGEELTGCLMCCYEKVISDVLEEDLDLVSIVARALGVEIARLREDQQLRQVNEELASKDKRMSLEMEIARTVHLTFLPSVSPEFSPYKIGFVIKPCFSVGGDYFDFFPFPDTNQLGIFFADISGHGVAGALLTSMLKTILMSVTSKENNPASILFDMNERIEGNFPSGYFVTAFFAILDSKTDSITFASAAPEPAILLKKNGEVEKIGKGGQPMGLLPAEFINEETFNAVTVKLEPGDTLLFFTDGLTDIKIDKNERIGINRLCDWLSELAGQSPQQLSDEIYRRAYEAAIENGIDDDIMLLAIKRD